MCILKLHTTLKIQKNQIILKNQRYFQVASIVATVVELPAGRAYSRRLHLVTGKSSQDEAISSLEA